MDITRGPGHYRIAWPFAGLAVVVEVDRLRAHSDGRLGARLRVQAHPNGGEPIVLHHGQLNLVSARTRRELARILEERLPHGEVNWDRVIEESCRAVLECEEHSFVAERLQPTERLEVSYLLEPLILSRQPSIVFAGGGSGKSYLSLYMSLLVQNGLDLELKPAQQTNVLFLDYETSREETARRCTLLAAGLRQRLIAADLTYPYYARGLGSLADRSSDIAREVFEKDIGLVVVDSVAPAAGGDILAPEPAIRFFESLRQICAATNAAGLILAHVSKQDGQQTDAHRTPFGSVFFINLARLVFELRTQDDRGKDELVFGLFARKANSGLPEPLGFKLTFESGAVVVNRAEAHDVITEQGATQTIILSELEGGPLSVKE